jgi:hypothetical protein
VGDYLLITQLELPEDYDGESPEIGDLYRISSAEQLNEATWKVYVDGYQLEGNIRGAKGDQGEKGDTGDPADCFSKTMLMPVAPSSTLSVPVSVCTVSTAAIDKAFGKYYYDIEFSGSYVYSVRVISNAGISDAITNMNEYPEVHCDNRIVSATTLRIYSNVKFTGVAYLISF